jgi:hypothetical protein
MNRRAPNGSSRADMGDVSDRLRRGTGLVKPESRRLGCSPGAEAPLVHRISSGAHLSHDLYRSDCAVLVSGRLVMRGSGGPERRRSMARTVFYAQRIFDGLFVMADDQATDGIKAAVR